MVSPENRQTGFTRTVEKFAEIMALLGGFIVVILMVMISADAIGRKFNNPVPGALEFSEALMVGAVFLPLMYVQMKREHVFVSIATQWLSVRWQSLLDGLAAVIGIILFGLMTWLAYQKALDSTLIGEYRLALINVPIWPFRWFIPLGTALLTLELVSTAVEEFRNAINPTEESPAAHRPEETDPGEMPLL